MTLHLYFARRFCTLMLRTLLGFAIFVWLVELLEHVRRFDSGEASFAELARLAALRTPTQIYEILPLIVLLTTVAMFVTLARTNELVVTRASGRSAMRTLAAPLIAACLIGAGIVAVANPLVATITREYSQTETRLRGEASVVSVGRDGLWLRQGGRDRQTAIHADSANADGTQLNGVTFYGFDGENTALYRVEAAQATLGDGVWQVREAKRWAFTDDANPEATATRHAQLTIQTNLTRDQIRDNFGQPSVIPIWELPAFIATLERAGFSARTHRVWFQSELAKPLTFAAMVLVGAIFTLRHTRMGRTGLMVLFAVLSGFAVYFVSDLAGVIAEGGRLPIPLAIWAPPAAAICLAMAMLLHLEDG